MDKPDRTITRPHDGFIKTVMSDPTIAREFFTLHLPAELLEITNLNHLVLQPNSYINDVRKESVVDLLYQTKISGHIAYLYLLLEHQSSDDPLMPFRMLKYTCNVIAQHLPKIKGKKKKLPLVYPLVIYHGKDPYSYSTNIADIVDAPRALVEKYF